MADSLDRLNALLRGEISAVETYSQVIERAFSEELKTSLLNCQIDHVKRVKILKNRIIALGGTPSEDSGIWGAFAKMVEGGASVFGEKAAIDILEEGEDHGLESYRSEIPKLDEADCMLVETQLLPAQEVTHRIIRDLKHQLFAA
jgi:demethoxyubiquinone hydroxylase (CLK1/Coq7/Cat5 family)